MIASARPSGLSPHHPFWTGFGRSFFLPAAQKIWTLKRQDQFSQGIQGPPELPRIAAQGTGQRQGIDKLLGEWGTRARSTSRPDPRLLVIAPGRPPAFPTGYGEEPSRQGRRERGKDCFCGTVLRLDFSCATAISVHPKMYPPLPLTRQAAV